MDPNLKEYRNSMTHTSVFSTQMASVKRVVAASLAVIGLAVGIGATPANALGVVVTDEPIVIDVGGFIVELDVPVNGELTSEEIIALYNEVEGTLLALKENLEGALIGREGLISQLEDLIQFTILPFLERALDTLVGLVITVKENLEVVLADGVCVTTGLPKLGSTCVTVG